MSFRLYNLVVVVVTEVPNSLSLYSITYQLSPTPGVEGMAHRPRDLKASLEVIRE